MDLRIIPRAEWGARFKNGFHQRALPAQYVVLHHSVTIAPDLVPPFDDDYRAVRTLEEIGQNRFGAGISYTTPITPAGLIFEGLTPGASGAHTYGLNDQALGIVLVGNYDVDQPTEEMVRAIAWYLVTAKRNGWIRNARIDWGHQHAPGQAATACPGRHGLAIIPEVNRLAEDALAGRINLEDDMAEVTALSPAALEQISWAVNFYGGTGGDKPVAGLRAAGGGRNPGDAWKQLLANDDTQTGLLRTILAVAQQNGPVDQGKLATQIAAALLPSLAQEFVTRLPKNPDGSIAVGADATAFVDEMLSEVGRKLSSVSAA